MGEKVDMSPPWRQSGAAGFGRAGLAGLYLRNMGANLLGFGIVVGLNVLTPLGFLHAERHFLFAEKGWLHLLLWGAGIFSVGACLQFFLQWPISAYVRMVRGGRAPAPALRDRARRRCINLPFLIGLGNLGMWVTIPAILILLFAQFLDMRPSVTVFSYFRSIMMGLIAATASFFLLEDCLRRRLMPILFPGGRLAEVPGTITLSIPRRIRFLYTAGTLIPMIVLVGTLYLSMMEADQLPIDARAIGEEFLAFCVFLCVVFIIIALRLNFLVGRSISRPIAEMMRVMAQVGRGDFSPRIEVVSNDEIGKLGDAGNAMIAGLAEREKIREAFGRYVTPEIRDEILSGRIPLEGERRVGTLLFSDLRDFTPYVERHTPEEVIRSLRAYFTEMEGAVRSHGGVVLQYVGDEIEAVFGIPIFQEDAADMALSAAIEMRQRLSEFNRERVKAGHVAFRHGIGIHTGEVLSGNTGSDAHLSYALIGDTVNIASRVQALTKVFGCDILVSEATVESLKGNFHLERKSPQAIRGHSQVLTIYRVI